MLNLEEVYPLSAPASPRTRFFLLKDTVALLGLLVVTALLFLVTHLLFGLYSHHQSAVADNWTNRGIQALQSHRPAEAVNAFRAALPYAADENRIQLLLAEALASAGQASEATAYYRTLWEHEPGNGPINLALARLAAKRGDFTEAWTDYHAALDGTWNGDGSRRRIDVRLELVEYLIRQKHLDQARGELLIASGNAMEDVPLRLRIAGLMEQAGDYGNALALYRKVLQHNPAHFAALEGAGRSAYRRGNYLLARNYLERTLNHPDFSHKPEETQDEIRNELRDSIHILMMYPSWNLSPQQRARRIAAIEEVSADRLASCMATLYSKNHPIPDRLNTLSKQWASLPIKRTPAWIAENGELGEQILELSYQIELEAEKSCGEPVGDDRLLAKIAATPQAVEVQ